VKVKPLSEKVNTFFVFESTPEEESLLHLPLNSEREVTTTSLSGVC
jgi:hypothetical protein